MRETFVRQLAASLWDEYKQSYLAPKKLSSKEFEQLGVPTQSLWFCIACRILHSL